MSARLKMLLLPAFATSLAFAVLVGLGVWQLQRLAWKEALVARIEARTTAPVQALPPRSDWPALAPSEYEYRHVTLTGRFENARETYILRASADGPMEHVVTPLELATGGTVLVDRGAVPPSLRNPSTRAAGQPEGESSVTGLMRPPEGRNPFTPPDEPDKRQFFTRDPGAIARTLGISDAAPFVVDADATPNPGGWPKGGDTIVAVPNNHLSYALTWFGLAFGLLAVFAAFAWKRLRETPTEANGGASLATRG